MTKMIYSCKGKLAALYGKQGERMLTRIHRENPQRLFINRFTTNPSALSLVHDHGCHTFHLLKKTDRKHFHNSSARCYF